MKNNLVYVCTFVALGKNFHIDMRYESYIKQFRKSCNLHFGGVVCFSFLLAFCIIQCVDRSGLVPVKNWIVKEKRNSKNNIDESGKDCEGVFCSFRWSVRIGLWVKIGMVASTQGLRRVSGFGSSYTLPRPFLRGYLQILGKWYTLKRMISI